MKNTIRRILSMTIALIMVFGAAPAFAAEIGSTALWDESYSDEEIYYDEYCYGGKVSEGDNDITAFLEDDSYYYYYEFDAEKSGYYLVSDFVYFGEMDDSGIIHYADYAEEWLETNNKYYQLVYFEEGTVIIGVCFFEFNSETLEIEFIDNEISNIVYDKSELENNIIEYDIYLYNNNFDVYFDKYTIEFSNGKKLEAIDDYLEFELENAPVNGENTVILNFAEYREETTATLYYIDYFVEDIEISNADEYLTAYEYYNGRYGFYPYVGEEITVTYTDGTSETFVYGWNEEDGQRDYITISGKKYFVLIQHFETDLTFRVSIAEHDFASYNCKTEKASINSNRNYLKENLAMEIGCFLENMKWYWSLMTDPDNIAYFFSYAGLFFENFESLSDISDEINEYLRFVFA